MDPCQDMNLLDLGDQESGIDLAYDMSVFLNGILEDQESIFSQTTLQNEEVISPPPALATQTAPILTNSYYQLKSKPVKQSLEESNAKHSLPRYRTNFKQELMREQIVKEEKKQAEIKAQQAKQITQSPSVPLQSNLPSVEVPPQILQVKTMLENPTYYHLKHSQQRQVRQYLTHSLTGSVPQSPVSSLPQGPQPLDQRNGLTALNPLHLRLQQKGFFPLSAPPNLLTCTPSGTSSPAPQSSIGTSFNSLGSEVDAEAELVEDILSLEADRPKSSIASGGTPTSLLSPQPADNYSQPVGHFNPALDALDSSSFVEMCAPVSPDDHVRVAQAKDRQKKDNHNMIERRRRFNINDRIKELGTLLPRNQGDPYYDQVGEFRPNKGTILKASVDFIKLLKSDSEKVKPLEEELKKSEMELRKRTLRIQELEQLLKLNGIRLNCTDGSWASSNTNDDMCNGYIKQEIHIKKEPDADLVNQCDSGEILVLGDLMEDDNIVVTGSGDPMLTQTLDSLEDSNSKHMHEGMDFI